MKKLLFFLLIILINLDSYSSDANGNIPVFEGGPAVFDDEVVLPENTLNPSAEEDQFDKADKYGKIKSFCITCDKKEHKKIIDIFNKEGIQINDSFNDIAIKDLKTEGELEPSYEIKSNLELIIYEIQPAIEKEILMKLLSGVEYKDLKLTNNTIELVGIFERSNCFESKTNERLRALQSPSILSSPRSTESSLGSPSFGSPNSTNNSSESNSITPSIVPSSSPVSFDS